MAEFEIFNGNGNPVCGGEFCPGHSDCSDCRRLRFLDQQTAEPVQAWYSAPLSRLCAPEGFTARGTFGQRLDGEADV